MCVRGWWWPVLPLTKSTYSLEEAHISDISHKTSSSPIYVESTWSLPALCCNSTRGWGRWRLRAVISYEGHRRFVRKSPLASALPALGQLSPCVKREKHTEREQSQLGPDPATWGQTLPQYSGDGHWAGGCSTSHPTLAPAPSFRPTPYHCDSCQHTLRKKCDLHPYQSTALPYKNTPLSLQ